MTRQLLHGEANLTFLLAVSAMNRASRGEGASERPRRGQGSEGLGRGHEVATASSQGDFCKIDVLMCSLRHFCVVLSEM